MLAITLFTAFARCLLLSHQRTLLRHTDADMMRSNSFLYFTVNRTNLDTGAVSNEELLLCIHQQKV